MWLYFYFNKILPPITPFKNQNCTCSKSCEKIVYVCLPSFLPSLLSLLLSLFLSSSWWVRYMNISLENCHLCCWLRTGINVDCINIRRLDFFFSLYKEKKKKVKPAAASSQLKLYNDVVKTEFFVHYQNLLCYFQQHHGLGCHMSTMYWFDTCFSSVRGYVAKRLTSHFPFVSPSSNPQWVKKKKKKKARKKLATLYLSSHSMNSKIIFQQVRQKSL